MISNHMWNVVVEKSPEMEGKNVLIFIKEMVII